MRLQRTSLTLLDSRIHCEAIDLQYKAKHTKYQSLDLHRGRNTLSSLTNLLGGALLDVLVSHRLDDVDVHNLGATEWRNTSPQQENCLEQEVERNPVQDSTRPELDDVQEGEHNPVGQQLSVVGLGDCVQGDQ